MKTLNGNWGATNYNYDNLSNITQMKLGSQTLNYVYGATSNRLESTTDSVQYDFQYDSSGNVTNNGFRTFDYDKQNRLITSQNVSFVHDAEDLIHSKAVVGEPTKYSLYGTGQDILYNFDSNGYGTVNYYLNDEIVANVKVSSLGRELSYQHNDELGSLAVETDASGNTIKTYHYEPYGFTLEAGQEDSPGFTGQIYDDDLGLNYMKARYYDPMIGRFYSNDPIDFDINHPMMFNRYAYAYNNPYRYTDPTGMCPDGCVVESVVVYAVAAALVATGICVEFCGDIIDGIENAASGLFNESSDGDGSDSNTLDIAGNSAQPPNDEDENEGSRSPGFKTEGEAKRQAERMGFKDTGKMSSQKTKIYRRGKDYITRDRTTKQGGSHNGGYWKVARSARALNGKQTRAGTYNRDLSKKVGK